MLPNFFIIGTPKAGTTSLYNYLKSHPDIFMSPKKEPNFFSFQDIGNQKLYYPEKNIKSVELYKILFKNAKNKIAIGDASVSYLFYEQVPKRIKKIVPNAKIIIILRQPTSRAFSHYLMDSRLGLVNLNFEDIVYKKTTHPKMDLYYQQFIELGFYHSQIKRYFDIFGQNNVKVFLTEDLKTELGNVLKDICTFLHIDNTVNFDLEQRHNVYRTPRNSLVRFFYSFKTMRSLIRNLIPDQWVSNVKNQLLLVEKKPALSQKTRNYLNELYSNDIKKTATLIQRDLTTWQTH